VLLLRCGAVVAVAVACGGISLEVAGLRVAAQVAAWLQLEVGSWPRRVLRLGLQLAVVGEDKKE